MALTYEPIVTYTVGSAVSDISFTSITNTYTDLVISISSISNGTNNPTIVTTINGDTGNSYSGVQVYSRSSGGAAGNKNIDASFISLGRATGISGVNNGKSMMTVYLFDYANTTKFKGLLCQTYNYFGGVEQDVATWRSTAAITSINFNAGGNSWGVGTVYTLYGIKAA
jgi:hypothetical protein